MRACSLPECDRAHWARGLCDRHYIQARRNGLPALAPDPTHHALTCVDDVNLTATCRACGPDTPIRWVTKRYRCAAKLKAERTAKRKREAGTEQYNEYHRTYSRRRLMGATTNSAVAELLEAIGYQCEICSKPLTWSTARFDHDHSCCPSSFKACGSCFRGILCNACNTGLGTMRDDPELLRRAADYLERNLITVDHQAERR